MRKLFNRKLLNFAALTVVALAAAPAAAGQTGLAIANYRKSLELNPQNTNAVEALKRLEGK